MDGGDRADDRTFRVNFTSEGVGKLRDTVKEKLKEFLGDYTDDTLVEYVIVLLKNGRNKEEAKNELDVFLGDESASFISWLWDHLESSLHLYIQSHGAHPDGVAKVKPALPEQSVKSVPQKLESESEKERSKKSSKSRHRREWKGLVGNGEDHQTLRSFIAEIDHSKEDSHRDVDSMKRSDSPQEGSQRKRFRPEERGSNNREGVQQAANAAPRRLLQSAVRDAVATSRPSPLGTEPSLKRLRSVVSTASDESFPEERPQVRRLLSRMPSSLSTAIKAVAEAAKDVKRVRPSRNVFDRLGRSADVSDTPKQLTGFGEDFAGDTQDQSHIEMKEDHLFYGNKINYKEQYASDLPLLQRDTEMASDPGSDYDGYDDMDVRPRGAMDVSLSGAFVRNRVGDRLSFPYKMAKTADERVQKARKDQVQPLPVLDTANKIVNTSANMNTWKSPQYQESLTLDSQKYEAGNTSLAVKSNVPSAAAYKGSSVLGNGIVKSEANVVKEPHKMQFSTPGLYSTGPPTEDADSRTIFVSNVHFGATKDSLSRHFNKFGEVLKVIILTDPATGLPKGSAYVEFMRKEAAEHALSLDGTSFMSRILKVVKKSSAPPETATALAWPRAGRAFSYPGSGFGMIPFPRGIPNVYRARPVKPGARSMQWKRDAPSIPAQMSNPANNTFPSTARGLTYVRTDPKTNGSSNDA